jgi:hypothetical protein
MGGITDFGGVGAGRIDHTVQVNESGPISSVIPDLIPDPPAGSRVLGTMDPVFNGMTKERP